MVSFIGGSFDRLRVAVELPALSLLLLLPGRINSAPGSAEAALPSVLANLRKGTE